jgi:hypothetical protein
MTLERSVDQAIAEENRRFLADPSAVAEAQAEGELYRKRFYFGGDCRRDTGDFLWCLKHDSPIGDTSDGWLACVAAITTAGQSMVDSLSAAQKALETWDVQDGDPNGYEEIMTQMSTAARFLQDAVVGASEAAR